MPKKIYDIKPPKVVNKIKVEQKPKETELNVSAI